MAVGKIKVVHLSYKDSQEGAAIAAERICKSLIKEGIDSKMLVEVKLTNFDFVNSISNGIVRKFFTRLRILIDRLFRILFVKNSESYFTFPFIGYDVSNLEIIKKADIIHIHWIGRGFISLRGLKKIIKLNKIIVWTLHDNWLVTGGCHIPKECNGFEDGCFLCPNTKYKGINRYIIKQKIKILKDAKLIITGPSTWSIDKIKNSFLLKKLNNVESVVIPNCINTDVFIPRLLKQSDIRKDKKIILFFMNDDKRKGIEYFAKALKKIKNIEMYDIFAFGSNSIRKDWFEGIEIKNIGVINDSEKLSEIYSLADVYVSPSLEEPFGQTYIEAMACKTAVVGFNYSGPVDIISHKKDGYLADYKNVDDLARGIEYCLENSEELGENARIKIVDKFSYRAVAKKLINIYNSNTYSKGKK